MRISIKPDILKYRKSCKQCCAFCNNTEKLEVDHINPFQCISDYFISKTKYKIPDEFNDDGYYRIFKNEDKLFEKSWIRHHNLYEDNLQMLCKHCNIIKSNN